MHFDLGEMNDARYTPLPQMESDVTSMRMNRSQHCRIEPLESRRLFTYTLTNLAALDPFGGSGLENGIANAPDVNNTGVVSAPAPAGKYEHGKVRVIRSGAPRLIDVANFGTKVNSYTRGINEKNQTVGSFVDSKSIEHAFVSTLGKKDAVVLKKLPDVKGRTGAVAYAINKNGLVAGSAGPLTSDEQAVVWTPDSAGVYKATALPRIGITDLEGFYASAVALDVNDAGVVAGIATDESLHQRGVIWKKGTKGYAATDLGALSGGVGYSFAYSINELGQAVGSSSAKDLRTHPVLFSLNSKGKYSLTDLGLPSGADSAEAVDINESGVIVGYAMYAGDKHAFLWAKNSKGRYVATDLSSLLPDNSQWTLDQPTSINDSKTIVGKGTFQNAETTWMLTFSGKGYAITLASQTSSLPAGQAAPPAKATPIFSTQRVAESVLL